MALKEQVEKFFDDHEKDFAAMARLFSAAADTGDPNILAYVVVCSERMANAVLDAMRAEAALWANPHHIQ
jgi:hypothetical protein